MLKLPDCQYLEWDSQILEMECGLIDLRDMDLENIHIKQVIDLLDQNNNLDFITLKIPQKGLEIINSLIRHGAQLIENEITFRFNPKNEINKIQFDNEFNFLFSQKIENNCFIKLAEDMSYSRFFLDDKIPKSKAVKLWQKSIEDHCTGYADELLTAWCDNSAAGIVTLRFKENKQLFLHIIGVLSYFRGKGLTPLMLHEIINKYANDYNIFIETQVTNIPAQKAYTKSGFSFYGLTYLLHYWSA